MIWTAVYRQVLPFFIIGCLSVNWAKGQDLIVTGTVDLSSANDSSNGAYRIVKGGTLILQQENAVPTTSFVYLGSTTTVGDPTYENGNFTNIFQLNGFNQSLPGLISITTNGSGGTDTNLVIGGSALVSTLTLTGSATFGAGLFGGSSSNANNLALNFSPGSGNSVTLTGGNIYTGGTEVSRGTLLLTNGSGSATGAGTFQLDSGAILTGTGTISGSGNAINSTVQVGPGGTTTTGSLTLTATGTTTFNSANLTFNLSTSTLGQGNQLALGATTSALFTTTTLTLNLQGGTIIPDTTEYTLLTSSTGGSGVGGSIFGGDIGYNSTTNVITGLNLVFNNAPTTGYYDNSYLKLVANGGGYDLDVEVVPEPGPWALVIMGGLGLWLVRRRPSSITQPVPS